LDTDVLGWLSVDWTNEQGGGPEVFYSLPSDFSVEESEDFGRFAPIDNSNGSLDGVYWMVIR
jgi:hypothetical protein